MNIERLKEAGIDYEEGLNRFVGKEDIYIKYLKRWLLEDAYENMKEAAAQGDIHKAFEIAHKLKGTTGNLSMNKFYKTVSILTEIYRSNETTGSEELLKKLDEMNEKLKAAVAAELD